jgi:hypothetical protein
MIPAVVRGIADPARHFRGFDHALRGRRCSFAATGRLPFPAHAK